MVIFGIIKHVMSSASESEMGALYYGCKGATPLRTTFEELSHSQGGPTPVTTNNSTAYGLTLDTMVSISSKENDIRFWWLKLCGAQRLLSFLWAHLSTNRADYPSKQRSPQHYTHLRSQYVVTSRKSPLLPKWGNLYTRRHWRNSECLTFVLLLFLYWFLLTTSNVNTNSLARMC